MKSNKLQLAPTKTIIIFWGNFGGGVRLSNNLLTLAESHSLDVYFSLSRNSEGWRENFTTLQITSDFIVSTPRNKLRTINIISGFIQSLRILLKVRKHKINQVVMLMPHPWDFIFETMAHLFGMRVLRCIHDAEPHSGDKLLPNWYIKLLARISTANIFFSNSVAEKFQHLQKESILLNLFDLPIENDYSRKENLVLFVGRIKKYKGLGLLAEAWRIIGETELKLKVCGSGQGIPEFLETHATVVNRWLADDEVTRLIGQAKVLVLPYLEASQSGLIPIAENLGTNIVITPIAGLIEQLSSNTSHVISRNFTGLALAEAINIAIQLPNIKSNNSNNVGIEMLQAFMRKPS